ncbi:MAG: hypothetical protein A2580_09225 [Hydrogenophilales bacterium RIFOXYD1_FULL_62_11]|nr:MAG: hypothetical protein A2580_09225 [Hydrogenophilales bacterium RIFOXYD1_FULL_62_11]
MNDAVNTNSERTMVTFVSAQHTADGVNPLYARFNVTQAFIDRMLDVQSLVQLNGLSTASYTGHPASWGPDNEDEMSVFNRTVSGEIVVSSSDFHFTDAIKDDDGDIESVSLDIKVLVEAWERNQPMAILGYDYRELEQTIADCGDTVYLEMQQ